MRVALAALLVAAVLAGWSLARALRVDPVPELPPPTLASAGLVSAVANPPSADIEAAVDKDPFSSDRTAPASRYRMPGEDDSTDSAPAPEPEKPVVVGTAVSSGGASFAVVQLGGVPPTSLGVGDKIGPYTVKTIERGHVVFTTAAGKRLDISALKP